MTRIPFQKTDIQEFKGIAKRLFRGLDLIDHKNPDRMRELVAKVFGYNDFHEVIKAAEDVIPAPAAPITRFDIRLVAADGLVKVANIPFVEAWLRAGRARLYGLSIDQFTVEALRSARLKARGVAASSHLAQDIGVSTPKWHDEQLRFFRNRAPSFELCVKHKVAAFHWGTFTVLYDAILSSRFKEAIINQMACLMLAPMMPSTPTFARPSFPNAGFHSRNSSRTGSRSQIMRQSGCM